MERTKRLRKDEERKSRDPSKMTYTVGMNYVPGIWTNVTGYEDQST